MDPLTPTCATEAKAFHIVVNKLREFFNARGFIEVPAQCQATILSSCEQPDNIVEYSLGGLPFPLPQTGQMVLEDYLLKFPDAPGYHCLTTSYRLETDPIPGRHDVIFPL